MADPYSKPSPGGRGLERTAAQSSFWRERVRGYGVVF